MKSEKHGFTLLELMVTVSIIGLILAIAVPYYVRARSVSYSNVCTSNKSKLEGAITNYCLDHSTAQPSSVNMSDLVPSYIKKTPLCPSSGSYVLDNVVTCNFHDI